MESANKKCNSDRVLWSGADAFYVNEVRRSGGLLHKKIHGIVLRYFRTDCFRENLRMLHRVQQFDWMYVISLTYINNEVIPSE
jgi:hypothetical protein